LAAIKGVGDAAMRSVVAARTAGCFKDLFDFVERVDPRVINRKQMENLTMAGGFDPLNKNRAQVVAAIDILLKHSHHTNDERAAGQSNMFGGADAASRPALPQIKAWDDLTRLKHEFGSLGFYLSAHPLDNYRAVLERIGAVMASTIGGKQRAMGSSRYKLAGIVVSKQERTSKNGNKFAFVQMSDAGGAFEVTVFSELLAAQRDKLEAGQAVLVEVDAQTGQGGGGSGGGESGGDVRFIARNVEPLAAAAERAAQGIRIKLYEPSPLADIKKILETVPKGRGKVTLLLDLDEGEEAEIELTGAWLLSEAMKGELRQVGVGLEVSEY
jgi:DNA polymerase-3 subunit alpha